jgi:hypothetical protein
MTIMYEELETIFGRARHLHDPTRFPAGDYGTHWDRTSPEGRLQRVTAALARKEHVAK